MKTMMMNLKRGSNSNGNSNNNHSRSCTKPFSPPRKNKSRYSNYSVEGDGDEEELLPDMIDSPSGSIDTISSGEQQQQRPPQQQQHVPPSLYSSSSRMQERFGNTLTKARNQRRRSRSRPRQPPPSHGHGRHASVSPSRPRRRKSSTTTTEPSNSSILMGADIIKRQLSGESPTRHRPQQQQPQQQYELYDPSESPITNPYRFRTSRATHAFSSSLDRENWDPWKTDEEEIQKKNRINNSSNSSSNSSKNDSSEYSKDLFVSSNSNNNNSIISDSLRARLLDYSKDSSLAATTKACSSRAQEILSNGDEYFDMRNNAISKSTALAEAAAACAAKNMETTMKSANANLNAHVTMNAIANTNPAKCMVQRLSELDDSTFASSSASNGYLPSKLLSGLTCGALNNPLITNCSTPQQQPTSALPSTPPVTTAEKTIPNDEELETSTLDFLANLHVKEEDLNFVFTNLENEEELCAGAAAVAQTATEHMPWNAGKKANSNANANTKSNKEQLTSSSYVTAACTPFEKMLSSRSSLHDELMKDPGYQHALKAGTLWQSLCSQHVRFPAHWWDGQEPHGPPMGSSKKRSKPWSYLGRHRVQGDSKLNYLIGNRSSSGRILLHLIVRDEISGEPMEDICCGCFHPNARGIRTTHHFDPNLEDCRDVWIAHRRRFYDISEDDAADKEEETTASSFSSWPATTIESLLQHQNKGRIHPSPLGAQGGRHSVNNDNLRTVFGSKPPVYTVFCLESDLFELFQSKLDGSIPASVALLRHYLRYSQMK